MASKAAVARMVAVVVWAQVGHSVGLGGRNTVHKASAGGCAGALEMNDNQAVRYGRSAINAALVT
jgi:hypothetical protein